jgi:hypothetical protein
MAKKTLLLLTLILIMACLAVSCSKKDTGVIDTSISQEDVDLLIKHKRNIDRITGKYDAEIQKAKQHEKPAIIQKGKDEIDNYLKSNNLSPVVFMRKSKKILKGYLAFQEISEESLQKKMDMLNKEELDEEEIKQKAALYKKAGENAFKELTSELSDYEIQLVKANLKNLSAIVK